MIRILTTSIAFSVMLGVSPALSQSIQDYASLVVENDKREFDVKGAIKIGHIKTVKFMTTGAVIIDVRRSSQFRSGHIPGAISLELNNELTKENLAKHATKDMCLVFYCADKQCYESALASAKAVAWGYSQVAYFANGLEGWSRNGRQVEK